MPVPPEPASATEIIAGSGGTPLAVARSGKLLGLAHLKDIVKGGIRERFAGLREMGIPHPDDHRRQSADSSRHPTPSACHVQQFR
jgi:hypothetical protein